MVRKAPFFYGWVIVFLGALSMFATTPGQSDSFSLFMDSFVEEFGWSRAYVSSLFSAATLISGFMMFFAGRVVDRIGSKWSAISSAALLGIACIIMSVSIGPIILFFGFLLARFAGKGALDLSANVLAPQWFIERRAFAIMLVGLGGTAGGAVFPLVNDYLINEYGWRQAYRILAGGLWLVYIPIVLLFLISRPEDAGIHPYGRKTNPEKSESINPEAPDDEVSLTQTQALKTSAFWIIAFCILQVNLVGTGVTLHFVSIFRELGYSMTFAAQVMSVKPLVALVTVVLSGLVLDKIKRQHLALALACLTQTVAFVMIPFINSVSLAFCYAFLSGVSGAITGLTIGVLKPNLFGRRFLGGILGAIVATAVIGSAIGPVIFGIAFDATQSYKAIILWSALLPLLSAVLNILIRKPKLKSGRN